MTRRILALDGGGFRGIVPAVVLAGLEKATGRATAELFDLIAGTSTGGLLALGLTVPGPDGGPRYTARDMVRFYRERAGGIFNRSALGGLLTLGGLTGPAYPAEGIEAALADVFGGARLSECLTEVLIPAYDLERRTVRFFKRYQARLDSAEDLPAAAAARATSAAPTYFPPAEHGGLALIDGGVAANNPAMCGLAQALSLWPDDEYLVLSLGTGECSQPIPPADARDWGLIGWARPVLDILMDGSSDVVDYQIRQLLPRGRYLRLQPALHPDQEAMDDAGPENIRALELVGEGLWEREGDGVASLFQDGR